jgi:hypothetical protein
LLSKGRHTQRESPTDSDTTHTDSPNPRPAVPTGDQETAEADSAHSPDNYPESTSDHSDQSATAEDEHPSSHGTSREMLQQMIF